MAQKRTMGRHPKAFRKMAVARLQSGGHSVSRSKELGIYRQPAAVVAAIRAGSDDEFFQAGGDLSLRWTTVRTFLDSVWQARQPVCRHFP